MAILGVVLSRMVAAAPDEGQTAIDLSAVMAKLSSADWHERHTAKDELIKAGLAGRTAPAALIREMLKTEDPEVRSLLKEAIRETAKETLFNVKKGFLGISLEDFAATTVDGVRYVPIRIVMTIEEFPARKAGVKDGSLILKVDDNVCDGKFNTADFVDYVSRKHPGELVTLALSVDGKTETMTITLGERPEDNMAASVECRKEEFFRRWFDREMGKALRERQTLNPEP